MANPLSRRDFIASASLAGVAGTTFPLTLREVAGSETITVEMIAAAEKIAGLSFSPDSKRLVSSSCDGSILFWRLPDGR